MSGGHGYFIKDRCQAILARCDLDFMGTLCSRFPRFLCSDSASVLQPCVPMRAESSPSAVLRDILPGGLCDSRGTLEIWDVCGYRRTSNALSDVAVGCQSSPSLHPYALFTQQHLCSAWGLDPDNLQSPARSPRFPRVLLIHFLYSGCKWQTVFLFGFKVFPSEPFSHSASQTSLLNYLNFLKLKTLQTCFYFA